MGKKRELFFFKDYFREFYDSQTWKVQKKTQKTPQTELHRAEKIKKQYYEEKKSNKP